MKLAVLALVSAVSAHRMHLHTFKYDPSLDNDKFVRIDSELLQAERNIEQGVLGRQLGLTKMVGLKMHFKELEKNLKQEIVQINNQDGSSELKNKPKFDKDYSMLEANVNKLESYVPKIEKLEKELELLD